MEEKIFFDDGGVKVTNARFIVNSQTYAMSGVTSVKSSVTPPDRGFPLGMIGVGIIMLLMQDMGVKFFGLLIGAAGVWLLMRQKSTYAVFLSSASGEVQALTNENEGYIGSVIQALNEALIHRG